MDFINIDLTISSTVVIFLISEAGKGWAGKGWAGKGWARAGNNFGVAGNNFGVAGKNGEVAGNNVCTGKRTEKDAGKGNFFWRYIFFGGEREIPRVCVCVCARVLM